MTDLIGPASAPNATTTRPAIYRVFGAIDTWFRDCSTPASQDGTAYQADFFNGLLGQLRTLIRGNGQLQSAAGPVVPEVNTSDAMLLTAVQLLIARGQPNAGADTGSADALAVGPATPWPEYVKGARVWVVKNPAAGPNATTTPTLAVSGLAAVTIVRRDGTALLPGDLPTGIAFCAEFDGAYFRLVSLTWGEIAGAVQSGKWLYGAATGTGNAATVALFPQQTPLDGTEILVKWPAANTAAAPTFLLTGFTVKTVVRQGGGQIQPGDLAGYVPLIWDATLVAWRVNGIVASDFPQVIAPYIRPRATGNLTLFVNGSNTAVTSSGYTFAPGSDANNGFTAGAPFLTPQKALAYLITLDMAGFTATVQFADGTYTGAGINASGAVPGISGPIQIQGNTNTPANVIFNHNQAAGVGSNAGAIVANGGAQINVNGVKVQSANFNGIVSNNAGSNVSYQNVVFGTCAGAHVLSENLGFMFMNAGSYTIVGSATAHLAMQGGGQIYNNGVGTITLTGTPAFSSGFVQGVSGLVQLGMAFNGAATGPRYSLTDGAVIVLNGIVETSIPGSTGGAQSNGGRVDGGIGADWTSYNPALVAGNGSVSGTTSGYWRRVDKTIFWTVTASISAVSGGCTIVTVGAPPFTPSNLAAGGGRENGSTGKGVAAAIAANTNAITLNLADVSALAGGMLLVASGSYPIAA